MNIEQSKRLYTAVCESQGRTFDDVQAGMWHQVNGDLEYPVAMEALYLVLGDGDAFITPGLLRNRAKDILRTRLAEAPTMLMPSGLSPAEYRQTVEAYRANILNGAAPNAASRDALAITGRTPEQEPARTQSVPTLASAAMHPDIGARAPQQSPTSQGRPAAVGTQVTTMVVAEAAPDDEVMEGEIVDSDSPVRDPGDRPAEPF